jgi:hypothetical protein
MDSKIEHVCIKICVKLGKSTTETLEMLREAFGEHSLSWTAVFEWHSRFKTHLQLVLRSRKCGPIHPLPHTPSWHSASLVNHRDFTFFYLYSRFKAGQVSVEDDEH